MAEPAAPPTTSSCVTGTLEAQATDDSAGLAERLRSKLADQLREQGTVRSERVDAAVRAVPRHRFVPGVPIEEAYADTPIYTKDDGTGISISAASQPTIVAMMLEMLQVQPGQNVLELGQAPATTPACSPTRPAKTATQRRSMWTKTSSTEPGPV